MAVETALTLIQQAGNAYRAGQFPQAAESYLKAQQLLLESGEKIKAAEAANNASVALLQSGNAQKALDACLGTEQIFEQAGDLRYQAIALGNQAAALDSLNRLEEALVRYQLCSDLFKKIGDEENRAYVLKSISSLQIRTGHQLEALASMDAALQNGKQLTIKERFLKKLLRIPFQMFKRDG